MTATEVRVLEVGGTHVTAAAVDPRSWDIRSRHDAALDGRGTAAQIVGALTAAAATLAGSEPATWAVAMPDPFDYARGVALFRDVGKFDALYGLDLRRALDEGITPRPESITFVHDTEAFLVGEWTVGAAQGTARCAAITLGSGVGSAYLADGHLVHDAAGLPPGGRIHRTLLDGLPLEDLVSRRAIRTNYAARTGDRAADVREIAERARGGEPAAAEVLENAFRALGRALAPGMGAFRPEVLVAGGSMSASWDLIGPAVVAGLAEMGVENLLMRQADRCDDAALVGAAREALRPMTEVVR